MNRMASILLSVVLSLGSIAFVGGCGKQDDTAHAQKKSGAINYTHFSKWGLSFEYPQEWKEYPADRVAMMKDALGSQLRPYGREILSFAMITGSNEEIALVVCQYTTLKEMQPSEFVTERNQVYNDAKRAGDVTKVNYVKETKIGGLPGVEEDVERSNGGRGRTHKIINGKTVFEISFVVNNAAHFAKYSDALDHLVSTVALAGVATASKPKQEQNQPLAASSVVILVSKEQMDVIRSLPRDLVCFTPAKNPIKSMEGIKDEEFASWVGADLPQCKLMAAFGRKDTVVGLRMMGTGGFSFDKDPKLRLFITLESFADDIIKGGGVRIVFKEK